MGNKKRILISTLINASLFFLGIVLFFMAAEISSRLFFDESRYYKAQTWASLQSLENSQDINVTKYVDPATGLAYNQSDNSLDVDRYRYFDEKIDKNKRAGVYRIIVIGDSFTVGRGLDPKAEINGKYTTRLEKKLNEKIDDKNIKGFEILPFADNGLNTFQESIILEKLAMEYDPDMVILQYCDNDIGTPNSPLGMNDNNESYIRSKTRLLFVNGHIVPALPYLNGNTNIFLLEYSSFFRFISYKLNIFLAKEVVDYKSPESSFNSIKKIGEIAGQKKIPFIIMNFSPALAEFDYCGEAENLYEYGLRLHKKLKTLTRELDIPFYDMCDYVRDIHSIKSDYKGDTGFHYNIKGYDLAAGILKNAVLKEIINKKN